MNLPAFLAKHPVFTFQQFCDAEPTTDRNAMKMRLQRAQASGKLKQVARGLFAAVPPGTPPDAFKPDPYLVLAARDPEVVFCGHSALELNGLAYSVWHEVNAYRSSNRGATEVEGTRFRLYRPPLVLTPEQHRTLGVTTVDRQGVPLRVLTPERALVEGFRSPTQYGGLGEFLQSMRNVVRLRWAMLADVLAAFNEQKLFACVGWFLETSPPELGVKATFLADLKQHEPKNPQALSRNMGPTRKVPRWNLLVPELLLNLEDRDGPEF